MLDRFLVRLICAALLSVGGSVSAQVWIELVQVPERIDGRLGDGRNLLLTARITGDPVDAAWLAVAEHSEARVALQQVGFDRWQVNLAVGEAAALLSEVGRGQVRVFAGGGEPIAASVPLSVDIAAAPSTARGAREPWRAPFAVEAIARIVVNDTRHGVRSFVARAGDAVWLVPEDVAALEIRTMSKDGLAAVELRTASARWPLASDRPRFATARLTTAAVTAWRETGTLALAFPGGEEVRLRAVPRALEAGASLAFTVGQRQVLELPGSGGALEVSLGDITRGQVQLEIRTRDGEDVLVDRSVVAGERIRIAHGADVYLVDISRLTNFVIGDDFADLTVTRLPR